MTLGDLGESLDIRSVGPAFTARVLEFASTGFSIVASAADDRGDDAAPDLYLIPPDTGEPQLIWRNSRRDHSLVKLAADGDTIAFVDMPITGEAAWTLRLIAEEGAESIVLDELDDDPTIPTLVPSMSVYWPYVAWTAFHAGPDGPVSRLLYAQSPDWEPVVLAERPAAAAELWFPALHGAQLVYTELVYAEDRQSDERRVWLTEINDPDGPQRLDTSGLATMPVLNQYDIAWKEGDPGFHQLNWGSIVRYDPDGGAARPMPMWHEDDVNFPSAGTRFMTWRAADSRRLGVWDGARGEARGIVAYESPSQRVLRPHIAGSLITWLFVDDSVEPELSEIRYALVP
jgi:hypothetical protein